MPFVFELPSEFQLPLWEWELAIKSAAMPPVAVRTPDERVTPPTIPPARLRLASANIKYLSDLIRQLVELRKEEERDEYGVLRATEHAYEQCSRLLIDAGIVAAQAGRQVPRGFVSTDAEGGVRIEWVRDSSSVHLVVPAASNRAAYIYHEVGPKYATVPSSPEALADWLSTID